MTARTDKDSRLRARRALRRARQAERIARTAEVAGKSERRELQAFLDRRES